MPGLPPKFLNQLKILAGQFRPTQEGISVSTFKETVQRALGKKEERRYSVEGYIVFEFTPAPGRELPWMNLHDLRIAIKQAIRLHKWKDFNDHTGEEAGSFSYLSDGDDYQYHNITPPELHVWFHIKPGIECVRKSQVYAYEKHLEKVAEDLAENNPQGAKSVRYVFRVGSVKEFKA